MPSGTFLGMDNVDEMAVELLSQVQAGTLAPDLAVQQMVARLATLDGTIRIVGGVVEMAGVAICSSASGGACLAAITAAVLGADTALEGGAQIIAGEDRNSPLVAGMIAGGVDAATAQEIKGWLEIGAATVTLVNGVATIVKGGQIVARIDDFVPPSSINGRPVVKVGDNYFVQTPYGQVDALRYDLATGMGKPAAVDAELREFVNTHYRTNATVGSGSTADAVRSEIRTGKPVGNSYHSIKASSDIEGLRNWIKNNPSASPSDIRTAENMIIDLEDALATPKP
jgi:hypothetical protein